MIASEISSIIKESERRVASLFATYGPLTGVGSPIERTKLFFDTTNFVLIPTYLANTSIMQSIIKLGSVYAYSRINNLDYKELKQAIHKLRAMYDFEFWCASCVKIFDKTTAQNVPFILRKAQLKLVKLIIDDLFGGKPVRVVLLKARQWGGSTVIQMLMAWIQLFHRSHWNSVIVADVEDQARTIRSMYSKMGTKHPEEVASIKFCNFEGSSKNKELLSRDCVISIGSMQKPDSLRSGDIKMAHLSEVGLWKRTKERKPEDVIQTIIGSVPREPFTVVVLESTAKGIGNFFHNAWSSATDGASAYSPVFVSWFEIDIYFKPFVTEELKRSFVNSMSRDETMRFSAGATLEGLNWYRDKRSEYSTDWQMCSEFPSTPEEAFQTTGNPAHDLLNLRQYRPFVKSPVFIGEIIADAPYGDNALHGVNFVDRKDGDCWLWKKPDKTLAISDRYVVSLDIGGRNPKADFSVISIIDRYPMLHGGVEECIGTYRFHLDQDLTIWRAVQIAEYFNHAILVVESNSLNRKGQEGDHSLTILDEIKDHYDNLFSRTDSTRIKEGRPLKYGFHTNHASKTDLITQMTRRFRDILHIERDKRALDEAEWFELKPDGSYGAIDGKHDDIYMSRAIGLKVSQLLELPSEIKQTSSGYHTTTVIRTEAAM